MVRSSDTEAALSVCDSHPSSSGFAVEQRGGSDDSVSVLCVQIFLL